MSDVTLLLHAARQDEPGAADRLWQVVYQELRQMASVKMADEQQVTMLQATELVHEAWIRLSGPAGEMQTWGSRKHFFGAAAEAMRRILVEQARRRLSAKRGSGQRAESLEEADSVAMPDDDRLVHVHEVLDQLAKEDPQRAELVKLRFFAGLSHAEIAAILETSERTVRREWMLAKTWLFRTITSRE